MWERGGRARRSAGQCGGGCEAVPGAGAAARLESLVRLAFRFWILVLRGGSASAVLFAAAPREPVFLFSVCSVWDGRWMDALAGKKSCRCRRSVGAVIDCVLLFR